MPNKLGGCGIQSKAGDLFEYAANELVDPGLTELLKNFEAAYPYLKFIAEQTGINDPFDKRVVESYWIGNDLLKMIDKKAFYQWCYERYGKQASPKALKLLVGTVPKGALPHHSFHVFNSYLRNKHFDKILHFINECKISSGVVTAENGDCITVNYSPIVLGLKGFSLGELSEKNVYFKLGDKGFIDKPKIGETISFHWGFVCDKLTDEQNRNLKKITSEQLRLFNDFI
jgi:hypothetical protein